MTTKQPTNSATSKRFDWLHLTLLSLLVILITIAVTVWVVRTYIFPTEFTPVVLDQDEQQQLDAKLEALDFDRSGRLRPEKYSEQGASRQLQLSEKELNALLARNTDLAQRMAIDLSDDLISAKLLIPMDPDFPVLGGKTLKVRAGVEVRYQNARPVVIIKGVSLMGVPMPSAWLGGLKNIDLVNEFGADPGFWRAFAAGVEHVRVHDGELELQLKE